MKNYFNADERTQHIILLGMQSVMEDFLKSEAITPSEHKYLSLAYTNLKKFNGSVCDRFGSAYTRKIANTMNSNSLRLVGKYSAYTECVSHAAAEDMTKLVDDLQTMNCIDCKKENPHDCAVYNMCITCSAKSNGKESGCPFSLDSGIDELIDTDFNEEV